MELDLYREPSTDHATPGRLSVDGRFVAFTLEDIVRAGPKIIHETAIPAGRYRVKLTRSARFGRILPEVLDVPGFSGIRIHPGNTDLDTSGCILVGFYRTKNQILDSKAAMTALQVELAHAQARGEAIWLTIHAAVEPPPPLNA